MFKQTTMIIAVILISCLASFIVYEIWTIGSNEEDYSIVCIGGHEYWRANFATKGLLGIKLDENGKPLKCE